MNLSQGSIFKIYYKFNLIALLNCSSKTEKEFIIN